MLFLQHNAFDGEQWAPISKYDNEDIDNGNNWIMVGKKDGDPSSTCQQYEQLYGGKSPPWTADGSKTELKENILCCLKQEALKHEGDIARGMNPIWMDSSHGWTGGSYNDGEEFCAGLGGKTLCPYAACEFHIWISCLTPAFHQLICLYVISFPFSQIAHTDLDRIQWEDTQSTSTWKANNGRQYTEKITTGC